MSEWPDTSEKSRGDHVEEIHPYSVSRGTRGIVVTVDDIGNVLVRTGPGSSIYGPAEHWRRLEENE